MVKKLVSIIFGLRIFRNFAISFCSHTLRTLNTTSKILLLLIAAFRKKILYKISSATSILLGRIILFSINSKNVLNLIQLKDLRNEKSPKINVKAGRGIGVVEVPRGILFHDYILNDNGECIKANCVIPTNQNHRNIQNDM